jgi:hypothetical protein
MTVWDAVNTTGQISFSSSSASSPLGYIVENKALTNSLFDLLHNHCPNVTIHSPAKVESISTISEEGGGGGETLPPSWLRLKFKEEKRNPIGKERRLLSLKKKKKKKKKKRKEQKGW